MSYQISSCVIQNVSLQLSSCQKNVFCGTELPSAPLLRARTYQNKPDDCIEVSVAPNRYISETDTYQSYVSLKDTTFEVLKLNMCLLGHRTRLSWNRMNNRRSRFSLFQLSRVSDFGLNKIGTEWVSYCLLNKLYGTQWISYCLLNGLYGTHSWRPVFSWKMKLNEKLI